MGELQSAADGSLVSNEEREISVYFGDAQGPSRTSQSAQHEHAVMPEESGAEGWSVEQSFADAARPEESACQYFPFLLVEPCTRPILIGSGKTLSTCLSGKESACAERVQVSLDGVSPGPVEGRLNLAL